MVRSSKKNCERDLRCCSWYRWKPDHVPALRVVLEKQKLPICRRTISKKAIDKATGNLDDVVYESIQYEGYGPGGIAVMVECLTDNRNRTASTVRANFSKHGGNLGTNGSVSYLFKRKGVITFEKGNIDEDTAMMTALDAGADDFDATEDGYEIYTTPDVFLAVKDAISSLGVEDFYDL